VSPFSYQNFPKSRLLFNVIRTRDINNEPFKSTFVGSTSQVCRHPEVLAPFGLQSPPSCGSTTIQTP
jgi:hypothetical protein